MNALLAVPLIYLVLINIVTFFVYCVDKFKAGRGSRRIPERALHGTALVGGVWGAVAAMILSRHKIRKKGFIAITGLIAIVNMGYLIGLGYLYLG